MNFYVISLLFSDLSDFFANPLALLGVVLASIGLATTMIAKRLTKAIRHTDKVDSSDKVYVGISLFGLVMILVALILVAVASSQAPIVG